MKKVIILLTGVVCAAVGAAVMFLNRPYSLLLELNNDNKSKEWSIASEPETFVSDYHNITENVSEFHIIVLDDGNGEMVFQCTEDDSTDKYILELSISRHQKIYLQIDSISFKK